MECEYNLLWLFGLAYVLWFWSNWIEPGLDRGFCSAIYDLPKRFVAWFDTISKLFVTLFSIEVSSSSSRAAGNLQLVAHSKTGALGFVSSAMPIARHTSIIQMRSRQEVSSCGLLRDLSRSALNPFSRIRIRIRIRVCFACIYMAFAWGRFCGAAWRVACNTTRPSNGAANGKTVSRLCAMDQQGVARHCGYG